MSDFGPFVYGELVRVLAPGRPAFTGHVYSAYRNRPGGERLICVYTPDGAGVAFRIRYVKKLRRRTSDA